MAIRNTTQWLDSLRPQVPIVSADELAERMPVSDDLVVVDIRELQERLLKGAIPGARHVPRGMLEFWADPASTYFHDYFREDAEYIVYCAGGGRSVLASLALMEMGYRDVSHLEVGFDGWAAEGHEVENVAANSKWVRRGSDG